MSETYLNEPRLFFNLEKTSDKKLKGSKNTLANFSTTQGSANSEDRIPSQYVSCQDRKQTTNFGIAKSPLGIDLPEKENQREVKDFLNLGE